MNINRKVGGAADKGEFHKYEQSGCQDLEAEPEPMLRGYTQQGAGQGEAKCQGAPSSRLLP